jgi:uncharacterized membrane protein
MNTISRHITRCMIAGIVALLPVGGTVLAILYMEDSIADAGLRDHPLYFPGVGLIAAAGLIYVVGLVFSTFLGRWLWRLIDSILEKLPGLGLLYRTLKQILGYGKGEDAIFQEVVLVPSRSHDALEIGLVTNRARDPDGVERLYVFVPGAPNPADGRLLLMEEAHLKRLDVPVSEAMKNLLSVGKTDLMPDHA